MVEALRRYTPGRFQRVPHVTSVLESAQYGQMRGSISEEDEPSRAPSSQVLGLLVDPSLVQDHRCLPPARPTQLRLDRRTRHRGTEGATERYETYCGGLQ